MAWGAVLGALIATVVMLRVSFARAIDPLWKDQLTEEELRALGGWIVVPASAVLGALLGLIVCRRLRRR